MFFSTFVSESGFTHIDSLIAVSVALVGGAAACITAAVLSWQITKIPLDDVRYPKACAAAAKIAEGARAFLIQQYRILAVVVVVLSALLGIIGWQIAVAFFLGAVASAFAGWMGMSIATKANIRTTIAATDRRNGLANGLSIAFKSGAVMGLTVVGTGLLGVSLLFLLLTVSSTGNVWSSMAGFAFGCSLIALFARVGGGIFTKGADVGADLVGKVEAHLEEDDVNNPATIADNVGDNVGDVAGMGADLFESFVGSIIASCTLGYADFGMQGVALPLYIAGFGALCSVLGVFLVRIKPEPEPEGIELGNANQNAIPFAVSPRAELLNCEKVQKELLASVRTGIYTAAALSLALSLFAVIVCFGYASDLAWRLYGTVCIGIVCGIVVGFCTEYATSYTYYPTRSIAERSHYGPATVIIQGLGVGMLSTIPPVLAVSIAIIASAELADVYGISIAAVAMLSTLGVTLATDAYGPVADNAGGIAEMASDEISHEVRERTDALDALGNTTAATGKGFAIASAVLTSLALMTAFAEDVGIQVADVSLLDRIVLPGILLGAMFPFVFAAMTMLSVGKAAESIMWEVRRQITDQNILNGGHADHQRCVEISTQTSLREMIPPCSLAIVAPVVVGFILGAEGLLGLLAGAICTGFLLAIMMSNCGGAWDNAKKYVEKGFLGAGKGKHSSNHAAVVVGDTIGDPFKDTSGPALNILIKQMAVMALVLAPVFDSHAWETDAWWVGTIILVVGLLFLTGFYIWLGKQEAKELETRRQIEQVRNESKDLIKTTKLEASGENSLLAESL